MGSIQILFFKIHMMLQSFLLLWKNPNTCKEGELKFTETFNIIIHLLGFIKNNFERDTKCSCNWNTWNCILLDPNVAAGL